MDDDSMYCYKVFVADRSDANHQPLGWNNANHACMGYGGQLASIHDAEEDQYIVDEIKKLLKFDSQGFWIGLNNKYEMR